MNRSKKFLTVLFLVITLTGTCYAAKWKELIFTEDISHGLAELNQYCMLHDITLADVLWANNVESGDIKPGQSLYLPNNHADMLAIWQHKGAWQPTALVPVTSAAAAKRASKLAEPSEVPMPKLAGLPPIQHVKTLAPEPKPEPKAEPKPELKAEAKIETVESAEPTAEITEPSEQTVAESEPDNTKSNDDLIAQLRDEVRTDARNLPPEPKTEATAKAEAPAKTEQPKAENTQAVQEAEPKPLITSDKPRTPSRSLNIPTSAPLKKQESPQKVIANSAKPDKILTAKPRKVSNELASLNDPIIILSPNGDPSKGPMRLVISGDKVEVVQLPKNAAPKRPSLADLDHTFGTYPDYLPHYNMTLKPRKDPFMLNNLNNIGNLAGKMLWPVDGKISSPFGKWRGSHKHQGIDIPMPAGTPIRAAKNGIVTRTGNNSTMGFRGYGNFVLMDHGDSVQTFYAHCLSVAVAQGQRVMQGQIIGYVGSTGRSTANHLHFEVRVNNNKVNPVPYLAGNTHFASTK